MQTIEPIIGREFPEKVIPLIDLAKNSIKIIVFDWRWYPNDIGCAAQLFNAAIIRAKNRGVKVSAILTPLDTAKILQSAGCFVKQPKVKKIIHAKMMILDDKILILGSHNYTQSAFTMNQEVSIILQEGGDLSPYLKFFDSLFSLNA